MTDEEIASHKTAIDAMTQEDMARLWRCAPAGHPYFQRGSGLYEHFERRFKGFTPAISKSIGWETP